MTETVESVLQGEEVPTELVIVDQSDVPNPVLETLTTDRSCNIRYVRPDSVGLSRARNSGIAASQHDILAIIDDDMFVTHTWCGSLIRALIRGGPRTVVTGRVLATEPEVPGGFVPAVSVQEVLGNIRRARLVCSQEQMAAYLGVFDKAGGLDEPLSPGADFTAAQDTRQEI